MKTILGDRPAFDIAIYHSFEEVFLLPRFIIENLPNYIIEFRSESVMPYSLSELAVFAYPAEILYNTSAFL